MLVVGVTEPVTPIHDEGGGYAAVEHLPAACKGYESQMAPNAGMPRDSMWYTTCWVSF